MRGRKETEEVMGENRAEEDHVSVSIKLAGMGSG